jgi:predicted lipoprotein with Yx(FWY)xxD motif
VRHPSLSLCAAAALAVATSAIAGCGGSSSTSTTSAANSASASTAAQGSPYGVPSSTSAASTTTSAASTTTSAAASSGTAVVVSTKHGKLGTILAAGGKRLTVYMFEGDKGTASSCSGACAHVWPPVTTSGSATVGGAAVSADLGTITRADGTKQVTYKGHPLYFFARDGDAGDAYGQGVVGFGSSWYVLSPSGAKVDHS